MSSDEPYSVIHQDGDKLLVISANDIVSKSAPSCRTCGKTMWWHGATQGWGCPGKLKGPTHCRPDFYGD